MTHSYSSIKHLFLLLLCCCSISLSASIRSTDEAAQIAAKKSHISVSKLQLAYTQFQQANQSPAFYVFNKGTNNGYILMSADDQSENILGYADEGTFIADSMPENMRVWFEHYAEEIATLNKNGHYPRKAIATAAITPLLDKDGIKWNQNSPYNKQCPYDSNNKQCVTGCVATAFGQIMRYWKYPEHGTGSYCYEWQKSDKSIDTLCVDFSQATYDWNNMLGTYSQGFNSTQMNAVSTLLYHLGVAGEMEYSSTSSGSNVAVASIGVMKHFDYDQGMYNLTPESVGEEEFEAAILADLKKGRPVLVSGTKASSVAHAFVCDGVDTNGLFHINWGWGGTSNGYFAMSALDPKKEGIGGSSSAGGYCISIAAKLNIKPNNGGQRYCGAFSAKNVRMENATTIGRQEQISITLDTIKNAGLDTINGFFSIGIYKDGKYVNKLGYKKCTDFKPGYFYPSSTCTTTLPSSIVNGTYQLIPVYTLENNWDNPITMPIANYGDYVITIEVTSTTITFELPTQTNYNLSPIFLNVTAKDNNYFTFNWIAKDLATSYLMKIWNSKGDTIVRTTLEPTDDLSYSIELQLHDMDTYNWSVNGILASGKISTPAYGKPFNTTQVIPDYTLSNLKISSSQRGINWRDFTWECASTPDKYVFWMQNKRTEALIIDTITTNSISKEFTQSSPYSWGVVALDKSNQMLSFLDGLIFNIIVDTTVTTDYSLSNLSVKECERGSNWREFSWTSNNLPAKYILWIQDDNSKVITRDTIAPAYSYIKQFSKPSTYNWGIVALDSNNQTLSSANGTSFIIPKDSTESKLDAIDNQPVITINDNAISIIYPNDTNISIYDITGKLIYHKLLLKGVERSDYLPSGIYILHFSNTNKKYKLIIP